MPLTIGYTFAGYRVLRLLGSGGMGEVYLVQHPRLPRQEALKVLRSDISSDASFRERFTREADLAAGLRHPHIVGIHDRGECDRQLWITMDHIDGTDLSHLLGQRYPQGMPVGHVLAITTAIASALDYAHKKGLLHRDIKPANIIVADIDSEDPNVFLADFGIARPLDDTNGITATNMTVGTVAYAAPEQLMGDDIDGRADQYALAATAYHLLTGTQLFPHTNAAVVISRHLNAAPPKLADSRPDLADFDPVLQAALAKEPVRRYPSCTAFGHNLARAIHPDGEEVSPDADTRQAPRAAKAPSGPNAATFLGNTAHVPTAPGVHQRRSLSGSRVVLVAIPLATVTAVLIGVAISWQPSNSQSTSASAGSASSAQPPLSSPSTSSIVTGAFVDVGGIDSSGFTRYAKAQCRDGDRVAMYGHTVASVFVVCSVNTDRYYFASVRVSDGFATGRIPDTTRTADGFDVTSNYGTAYRVRTDSVTASSWTGLPISSEPVLEYRMG